MFWKHRNLVGVLLLLTAALLWVWGRTMLRDSRSDLAETTTVITVENTLESTIFTYREVTEGTTFFLTDGNGVAYSEYRELEPSTVAVVEDPSLFHESGGADWTVGSRSRAPWIAVCVLGCIMGLGGILVLPQRKAVLGPDGMAALWFFGGWWHSYMLYTVGSFGTSFPARVLGAFLFLVTLRILWGWCLSRFSPEFCLLRRTANRLTGEGWALLLFLGWFLGALAGLWVYSAAYYKPRIPVVFWAGAVTAAFGLLFLGKYAVELQHFRKQLDFYRRGLPIEVKKGTFAQTEEQLLQIRREHEEAVKTAVIGERFKVDLIANVSHDLRTPLTSILGYSELLEKEALSPKGKEQLSRLHEKSVYMNELVESLFELTKVESGALEPRKEKLDLVRLLEQTVGFLDDRLQERGLEVRRYYEREQAELCADGGMLHQVFSNLLGNAIKYALPGTRIYLELQEEGPSLLVRMVNTANYEMDFSEEEILERFARGDKARSTRGSGLGLAIARTYTEALGGTFRIKVDGDQFSAFVTLPKTERDL